MKSCPHTPLHAPSSSSLYAMPLSRPLCTLCRGELPLADQDSCLRCLVHKPAPQDLCFICLVHKPARHYLTHPYRSRSLFHMPGVRVAAILGNREAGSVVCHVWSTGEGAPASVAQPRIHTYIHTYIHKRLYINVIHQVSVAQPRIRGTGPEPCLHTHGALLPPALCPV